MTFSVPPERGVPETVAAILRHAAEATEVAGIDYFVGGALARDLLLFHVFGEKTTRATRDVDLMVCVEDWGVFEGLRERLVATGQFAAARDVPRRLLYGPRRVPLDLVPFGGVEEPPGTVTWPRGQDVVMSVVGFHEAARTSIPVKIDEDLTVPAVALAALSLLKLTAWMDRHHETSKDAIDLLTLLRLYSDAGNEDRLYGEETDLLESSGFDPVVAGARLLGRDAVALCGKLTSRALLERLTNPLRQELENHLLRGTAGIDDDASQARTLALLAAYLDELAEASATQ